MVLRMVAADEMQGASDDWIICFIEGMSDGKRRLEQEEQLT